MISSNNHLLSSNAALPRTKETSHRSTARLTCIDANTSDSHQPSSDQTTNNSNIKQIARDSSTHPIANPSSSKCWRMGEFLPSQAQNARQRSSLAMIGDGQGNHLRQDGPAKQASTEQRVGHWLGSGFGDLSMTKGIHATPSGASAGTTRNEYSMVSFRELKRPPARTDAPNQHPQEHSIAPPSNQSVVTGGLPTEQTTSHRPQAGDRSEVLNQVGDDAIITKQKENTLSGGPTEETNPIETEEEEKKRIRRERERLRSRRRRAAAREAALAKNPPLSPEEKLRRRREKEKLRARRRRAAARLLREEAKHKLTTEKKSEEDEKLRLKRERERIRSRNRRAAAREQQRQQQVQQQETMKLGRQNSACSLASRNSHSSTLTPMSVEASCRRRSSIDEEQARRLQIEGQFSDQKEIDDNEDESDDESQEAQNCQTQIDVSDYENNGDDCSKRKEGDRRYQECPVVSKSSSPSSVMLYPEGGTVADMARRRNPEEEDDKGRVKRDDKTRSSIPSSVSIVIPPPQPPQASLSFPLLPSVPTGSNNFVPPAPPPNFRPTIRPILLFHRNLFRIARANHEKTLREQQKQEHQEQEEEAPQKSCDSDDDRKDEDHNKELLKTEATAKDDKSFSSPEQKQDVTTQDELPPESILVNRKCSRRRSTEMLDAASGLVAMATKQGKSSQQPSLTEDVKQKPDVVAASCNKVDTIHASNISDDFSGTKFKENVSMAKGAACSRFSPGGDRQGVVPMSTVSTAKDYGSPYPSPSRGGSTIQQSEKEENSQKAPQCNLADDPKKTMDAFPTTAAFPNRRRSSMCSLGWSVGSTVHSLFGGRGSLGLAAGESSPFRSSALPSGADSRRNSSLFWGGASSSDCWKLQPPDLPIATNPTHNTSAECAFSRETEESKKDDELHTSWRLAEAEDSREYRPGAARRTNVIHNIGKWTRPVLNCNSDSFGSDATGDTTATTKTTSTSSS